jgi:prepilin-type N-terminal cleavage/methylation domain-containing protein
MERRRGFTLIELLVVIAVIAIIAAILFPVFAQAREKAHTATCLSNCKQLGMGVVLYAQDYDEAILPYILGPAGPVVDRLWTARIQPYLKNGAPVLVGGRYQAAGVMRCPAFTEDKFGRAADAPECDGPGTSVTALPSRDVFATYGFPRPWMGGVGTPQSPFAHVPWSDASVTVRLPMVLRPAETAIVTDGLTGVSGGSFAGRVIATFGCEGAEMHQSGEVLAFLDGHAKWIAGNPERYQKRRADGKWFMLYFTYDME